MSKDQVKKYDRKEINALIDKFVKTATDVHGEPYAIGYMSSLLSSLINYASEYEHDLVIKQIEKQIGYLHETSYERLMRERKAA